MKKSLYLIAGILIGAALTGGSAAVAAGITAERSHHRVVVDGKEVQMEAYVINGNNYVKLRDMGKWDLRSIGTALTAVCRWKATSPTPAKHLQRQNPINRNRIQNPQSLPMMPMWMP